MKRKFSRITASVFSCMALLGTAWAGADDAAPAAPADAGKAPANAPVTAPTTNPATVAAMRAMSAVVDQKVKVLADGSDGDRQVAEDFLLNLPPPAMPLIEAAAGRPGLGADVKQRLEKIVARRRPLDRRWLALEKVHQEEYEWNLRSALEAYDKVGSHNPKWDDLARQAIRQYTSLQPDERAAAYQTLEHITSDLKCDDPLIGYFDARELDAAGKVETDRQKQGQLIGNAMSTYFDACAWFEKSKYPADRKCAAQTHAVALVYASSLRQDQQLKVDAQKWAGQALTEWPDVVKVPGIPARFLSDAADAVVEAQVHCGADRGTITDQVFDSLNKVLPKSPMPLVFMGRQYTTWAWDARGRGFANTVTPEGLKQMQERLAAAENVLIKAYDRDPGDPAAATAMLTVELGQGQGRDVMEKWFKRAIEADPGYEPAYSAKMYYLEPKWYGSPRDMLAFGRECVETRNWRGDIPWVLVRAHQALAGYVQDKEAYWHEQAVWKDVESVVVPPLKIWPQSVRAHSLYAYWAWRCGQWSQADAEFKRLGDKLDASPWGGKEAAEKAREESTQKAAEQLQ